MARPKNTDARRDEIIDGLMQVLAQCGYAKASVKRIAEAAGLAPGLVHYHFKNKLQILLALVERLAETTALRVETRVEQDSDPFAKLEAFLSAHLARGDDEDLAAVACWVAIGAEAQFNPEVAKVYRAALEDRHAHLTALIQDVIGRRKVATARAHATTLLAAIEGHYQLGTTTSLIPAGQAEKNIHALMRALFTGGAVRPSLQTSK